MVMMVSPGALAQCAPGDAITALIGDDLAVPCVDGLERPYLNLDAASTSALPAVADSVTDFLPWHSSVHRGAGYKSQLATAAYEEARAASLGFSGRTGRQDVAIICPNTTERSTTSRTACACGPTTSS
jgi:selenocysteine lyase/cysteine desulfurase